MKLYLQKSPEEKIKRCIIMAGKQIIYVTNVFVFVPDRTISIAFFNVLGSVLDRQVAKWGGIYDKLESVYKSNGGICIVDSAFGKIDREFLMKTSQDYLCSNKAGYLVQKKIYKQSELQHP